MQQQTGNISNSNECNWVFKVNANNKQKLFVTYPTRFLPDKYNYIGLFSNLTCSGVTPDKMTAIKHIWQRASSSTFRGRAASEEDQREEDQGYCRQ